MVTLSGSQTIKTFRYDGCSIVWDGGPSREGLRISKTILTLEAQRCGFRIKGVQADWRKSHADGELGDSQLEGLERRAKLLLDADDSGWKRVLDDEEFWKAGWGSTMER